MIGSLFLRDESPVLRGGGLILRSARRSDYDDWRSLRAQSRTFLKPFEPRWSEADLSRQIFHSRIRRSLREAAEGTEFGFLIFRENQGRQQLVGGLTLSNIRRRAAQCASMGYWMGEPFAGQGIMTRAVGLVVPFVFGTLSLHRLHAACLPDNAASRTVLERNGFREEGYAENYLQIDGAWRDHVLYALTRERYEGKRV